MELKHYLVILRRWGWIMLLCTILASVASYWFSSRQPRVYESRARYLVGPVLDNPNVSSNDMRASSQVGQTYAQIVTTRPIVQGVIDKLKLDNVTDADTVAKNVTATWIDAAQILSIRVHASDPQVAADIANALGEALIERSPGGPTSLQAAKRQDALNQIAKLQETIRATEVEIDQLTNQIQQTTDQVAQRALIVRLDERRAQLAAAQRSLTDQYTIVQSSGTNQIAVAESAVPDPVPIAPEVQRNVLAALIAGLVLGLAAMLLFEYFTDVIYTPEELRKATGLPYLGGIARHKRMRGSGTAQVLVFAHPERLAAESYRMLRTNLQMIGTDQHPRSLVITSPSRGDGKSDIAANLAVALAQIGKRVILIDANLRRPRIGALFGLPEGGGLSSLLNTSQAIEPRPIAEIPGLSVLPAGSPAPNSADILGSERMSQLLQEFQARADVIVIDSAPLLYSDALALAPQVDGVLLVANSGVTGRENTINAVESLRLVDAHLLGTVLNRVKAGPAYSYYRSRRERRGTRKAGATPALASLDTDEALQPPAATPALDLAEAGVPLDLTFDTAESGAPPALDLAEAGTPPALASLDADEAPAPSAVTQALDLTEADTWPDVALVEPPSASSTVDALAALNDRDDGEHDSERSITVGSTVEGYTDDGEQAGPEDEIVQTDVMPAMAFTNGQSSQAVISRGRQSRRNKGRS